MSEKPKPLQALVDALTDSHLRAERFKAGTGVWPYETPAEWYAAAVDLFGVAILDRPLRQVQLLVEGELTRRRTAAAEAEANDKTDSLNGSSRIAKREPKREIRKKFVPYVRCLQHPDKEIQEIAAELNRIGKPRGKTAAIIEYLDTVRTYKTTPQDARTIIERMKKYEQKKGAQPGT